MTAVLAAEAAQSFVVPLNTSQPAFLDFVVEVEHSSYRGIAVVDVVCQSQSTAGVNFHIESVLAAFQDKQTLNSSGFLT